MFMHLADLYGMVFFFEIDIVNEIWDSTAQNLHCRNSIGHRAFGMGLGNSMSSALALALVVVLAWVWVLVWVSKGSSLRKGRR